MKSGFMERPRIKGDSVGVAGPSKSSEAGERVRSDNIQMGAALAVEKRHKVNSPLAAVKPF